MKDRSVIVGQRTRESLRKTEISKKVKLVTYSRAWLLFLFRSEKIFTPALMASDSNKANNNNGNNNGDNNNSACPAFSGPIKDTEASINILFFHSRAS